MFAKLLALLAIVAMASTVSAQTGECTATATGSVKMTTSGRSVTGCYYSDAACATADDTTCTTMYDLVKAACEASPASCKGLSYSACSDGCYKVSSASQVATSAFVALAAAVVSQLF